MDGKRENNAKKLRNTGKQKIGFSSRLRKRTPVSNAELIFEDINSAFDESTMAIKIIPALSTTRNAGIQSQVFVGISINTFVGIGGARIVANTNELVRGFDFDKFAADKLVTQRATFAARNAKKGERGFIFGTNRRTVDIKIIMHGFRITRIERNSHSIEVKVIFEHRIIVV